jgi:hypothetical protein
MLKLFISETYEEIKKRHQDYSMTRFKQAYLHSRLCQVTKGVIQTVYECVYDRMQVCS